jgi:TatD DNase family protein
MLIDIHCHLHHCYFNDDLLQVIENAKIAGLKAILTAGIDPASNRKALEISGKYDIVRPCLGIYPIQQGNNNKSSKKFNNSKVENYDNEKNNNDNKIKNNETKKDNNQLNNGKNYAITNIDEEFEFIEKNKKKIAAISEIGLDYHWVKDNINEQKELFEKMISLAEKINKPVIVHSRKAEEDCIGMLRSSKLKNVVMHCFTGRYSLVKRIINNGWFLTAPTSIVRSTQFQENAKLAPITQLFCETDSPYLSPFKDKRNEPAFVAEAYKKLAEIKNMELKEVVNNVWMNWQKLFN